MAVNTSADKSNMIDRLKADCALIMDTIAHAKQLRQEALDKTYQPGGADGITDAFLNGASGVFPALAVGDVTAAFATIDTLDTTLAASSRAGYKSLAKLRP